MREGKGEEWLTFTALSANIVTLLTLSVLLNWLHGPSGASGDVLVVVS